MTASPGAMHAARLLLRVAYDPDQPRDPAGTSTGGQWSGGGVMFHGTAKKNLKSILKNGIQPHQGAPGTLGSDWGKAVFITPDKFEAQRYASTKIEDEDLKPQQGVIFEVHVPRGETFRQLPNGSLMRSEAIPASWIHSVSMKVNGKWKTHSADLLRNLSESDGDDEVLFVVVSLDDLRALVTRYPVRSAAARLLLLARTPRVAVSRYPVRDAADHLTPSFSVAIRAAFALGRKALPDVDAAVKAVARALAKTVPGLLARGLVEGGTLGAVRLKLIAVEEGIRIAAKKPLVMQFDAKAPRVKSWARKHAAELVKGLADVTRDRLRAIVAKHAGGDLDDAAYAKALTAAVGDVERAEVIARTESMRAVHEGQRQAWGQAVDKGLLHYAAKRTWIVTSDDRLCSVCEPLDGETADLDGLFADEFDGPPAHPNCRCTEGLA